MIVRVERIVGLYNDCKVAPYAVNPDFIRAVAPETDNPDPENPITVLFLDDKTTVRVRGTFSDVVAHLNMFGYPDPE